MKQLRSFLKRKAWKCILKNNTKLTDLMNEAVVWWATALASMVFPHPGGPYISTPLTHNNINRNNEMRRWCGEPQLKKKVYYLITIRTKCHLKKFLLSWVSELWIYILNLTPCPFTSILSYFYMCGYGSVFGIRIQVQKDPVYGSGSTTLLLSNLLILFQLFIGNFFLIL